MLTTLPFRGIARTIVGSEVRDDFENNNDFSIINDLIFKLVRTVVLHLHLMAVCRSTVLERLELLIPVSPHVLQLMPVRLWPSAPLLEPHHKSLCVAHWKVHRNCWQMFFTCFSTLILFSTSATTCSQPVDSGASCGSGSLTRYFYNTASRSCTSFQFNGCGGNNNNFATLQACINYCGSAGKLLYYSILNSRSDQLFLFSMSRWSNRLP